MAVDEHLSDLHRAGGGAAFDSTFFVTSKKMCCVLVLLQTPDISLNADRDSRASERSVRPRSFSYVADVAFGRNWFGCHAWSL